uniref:MIF4G domain-containing protein n=1 Tax=Panagrellus redivivus TaxID=6233 RepID=A0A7E4VY53_PANRE
MYINEYTATKNTIQDVLRSHDRPVSLENLVHELRQRVPNYLALFPKKELLTAYIASVLKKEIASCCIYDQKRQKTIPRYFLRNSPVAKAIGVTSNFHPAVDGVSAFADAMFHVYNSTDNSHVAFSDVKKLYKKRTQRALTNGELNAIAGTSGVTRMNVLRDHLSHLVTVVNDHFEQVACPAFYGATRDFFEQQVNPEKYNPQETARVRERFMSANEAAANDEPEEIDVDEDEGEITLADIKVNESFASSTSYGSSDMSAGLDQSLIASAEPPSPRDNSGLATIKEDERERQTAKDREFAAQAALLVQEREARLAAERDAAQERERIAAETRERDEREREAFEELERVRKEEEEQQRKDAERLEAEKREQEAEEKRQRELKEEEERKRLATEKLEREAAEKRELQRKEKEERDRKAAEKRQREAAKKRERELKEEADRKRLEAEKVEREAAAERKRLAAEAEEKRQLEAAKKREQERKAEEERKRLEAEKLEREAAAERKRLEAERLEREAAAERKRLEAEAEEKRQLEAAKKREQERKAEEERQRLEKEKRDHEAEEKRQREAAEKRELERKEKEERDAAEQLKLEAARKLLKEEEDRERAAAEKRENAAAEERKRLEAAQREREPIAVEVDSTRRLESQSSPLHIVEQLSPRYDPSDTEAINDYAQSQQTGSESSSPKPNSDVLFAHMREELIEKHAAHSVASYGSTSNGMAVSDFSPLPQANQRDSVFGETSGRTDSPVQKLNPSSDLEYAQFGFRRTVPRASDSTRATVASSSTSSMSLDVDNTQVSDGTGEFNYSQVVSQMQSADAADNASDSLSMDYTELAAAPLRATRMFGLSARNGSESSPQVSPTTDVPHHDHTVDSVTYADAVKEDATQTLSEASVGSAHAGTTSPNRQQRQADTVVDFSHVDAANPDDRAAAEDSFGSSNGDKENVPVHHDHVVVDLSYAEAAKLDGTVQEDVKQSVAAPLGAAPSVNELESGVVASPGEGQAFEHHDHVTSGLSYAGAVKHAAGDVNDSETENEIYTDKPFDNYLILRLLTGFEHGIIKSLDSESLPAFFRDYVEQDIDPVQTWNLTWENVVDNWGKLEAFDYRDGVLYPNEATKAKASVHDEAGCGDCEILTRTDAEIAASISKPFHGSETQFQRSPRPNDDDDYDVHSVYEDEIVPFSTDIEPIPKCDAMKDDEVHAGPKSCLTIRTPKSKKATSRVDQTGDVAPVNFSSSTSPKSTQPKVIGQPMLQKATELQEVALKAPPPTPSEHVVNEDNDVFLPGDEQEHPQHGEHERSGLNCFHLPRFSTKSKHSSSSSNKSPVDKNASVVVPMEPEPVAVVVDEEDPETAPTTGTANELLDASGAAAATADSSAADDDLEDGNRAVGISRRYCKCCTII